MNDLDRIMRTTDQLAYRTDQLAHRADVFADGFQPPPPGADTPPAARREWARHQRRRVVQRRRRLLAAHETLLELCACIRNGDVVAVDGSHVTRDVAEVLAMAADVRREYTMCALLLGAIDHVLATAA